MTPPWKDRFLTNGERLGLTAGYVLAGVGFVASVIGAFLDVMSPPVPARLARWLPSFMLASPAERQHVERLRAWLGGS